MMNRNRIVYLVDSDTSARRGLKHFLAAVGYKVEAFASYGEFLKIETIDKHGCLILDSVSSGARTLLSSLLQPSNSKMTIVTRHNPECTVFLMLVLLFHFTQIYIGFPICGTNHKTGGLSSGRVGAEE